MGTGFFPPVPDPKREATRTRGAMVAVSLGAFLAHAAICAMFWLLGSSRSVLKQHSGDIGSVLAE